PTTYVGDVPKKPSARIPSSSEPSAPPTSVDCSPPASWRPSSTSSATPPPVPGATSPPSPSDHANWPTSSCPRSRWPYATVGQARSCMPTTTTTVCPQLRTTVCSPNCSVNNGEDRKSTRLNSSPRFDLVCRLLLAKKITTEDAMQ